MKRAVITTAVSMLALSLGAPALPAEPPRIVDMRVARHPKFDRLVFELERRVALRRVPAPESGAFVIELEARPLLPYQTLLTPYARMGSVVVEEIPTGARIEVESRPRRVRMFLLSDPPRIVVDFGDPGAEPFLPPPGTEPVPGPAPSPQPGTAPQLEPATPPPAEPPPEAPLEDGGPPVVPEE